MTAAIALAFLAGVALARLYDRWDRRPAIRSAGHTPGLAGPFALGVITPPTNRDLWAWIGRTDDQPPLVTGRPRLAGEADTVLEAA